MAILLLPIPWVVSAAGLGKLAVLSTFGQPFRAEIDLLARQHELSALTSRLASPDTYKQAEVQYVPALAGLSLNVRKQSNGQAYIEVTSSRSINELYIELLVEIQLGSMRLIRRYTTLIDPAGFGPAAVTSSRVAVPETQPALEAQNGVSRTTATHVADKTAAKSEIRVVRVSRSKPPSDMTVDAAELHSLSNRVRVLEEISILHKREFAELNERIALMEKTVQVMQRSLDSRKPDVAATPIPEKTEPHTQIPEATRTEVVVAAKPEGAPVDTKKEGPKSTLPSEKPAAQRKPDKPAMKAVPISAGPGLVDSILGGRFYLVVGASVILLVALAFWMRHRRHSPAVTPEEILIKLLARNPGRDDLQFRLLEIYFAREDRAAFHRTAVIFNQLTGGQGSDWRKVAVMGNALDRGNPLYELDGDENSAGEAKSEVG